MIAGHLTPQGEKLNGWSLAVFWKHECKFFDGIVVDYDADLDQHTIHYNDGELPLVHWVLFALFATHKHNQGCSQRTDNTICSFSVTVVSIYYPKT